MQILLGANETIVKINSKTIKIDYIQHFINTHFLTRTITNNFIYIPQSSEDLHHRAFLLKWLYTLYMKKTNNFVPNLKETLIRRQTKPIKIILQEKIIHKIRYKIIDEEIIHIEIQPQNNQIEYKIKKYLGTKITIMPSYLSIVLDTKAKERFKEFIYAKNIIDIPHLHIFHSVKMEEFLSGEKPPERVVIDFATQAHKILGSTPFEDKKTIKKRYKKLAMQYHPDKVSTEDENTITLYTKKFQIILDAYNTLQKHIA